MVVVGCCLFCCWFVGLLLVCFVVGLLLVSKRPKTTMLFVVGLLFVSLLMALLFVCYKWSFSATMRHFQIYQVGKNACEPGGTTLVCLV
jgi:hypothetical protein